MKWVFLHMFLCGPGEKSFCRTLPEMGHLDLELCELSASLDEVGRASCLCNTVCSCALPLLVDRASQRPWSNWCCQTSTAFTVWCFLYVSYHCFPIWFPSSFSYKKLPFCEHLIISSLPNHREFTWIRHSAWPQLHLASWLLLSPESLFFFLFFNI